MFTAHTYCYSLLSQRPGLGRRTVRGEHRTVGTWAQQTREIEYILNYSRQNATCAWLLQGNGSWDETPVSQLADIYQTQMSILSAAADSLSWWKHGRERRHHQTQTKGKPQSCLAPTSGCWLMLGSHLSEEYLDFFACDFADMKMNEALSPS